MLYEYYSEHATNNSSLHVTYLLAGQPKDHSLPFQIALVNMNQLEQVKNTFETINSIHIYSISRTRPSTVSDLYRLDSNTHFPYHECGVIEYGGGSIEMKSKIKNQSANLEIAEPVMKGLQPKKEKLMNDEKEQVESSSSKKSTTKKSITANKKTASPKITTKHVQEELSDEEMTDATVHSKKNSSLILDEESDEDDHYSHPTTRKSSSNEISEDEEDLLNNKTKKSTSKKSKKTTPSKTQTNTLDKFTSQSPKSSNSSPSTTEVSSSEKKLTKKVKKTVQVKNEKGYLVSKEIWTEVPLSEEEIKQMEKKQQAASNIKKELSSDEDDNVMRDETESKKKKTKKESTSTSKSNKSVVSANPHSGPKQTSIGAFFKKK